MPDDMAGRPFEAGLDVGEDTVFVAFRGPVRPPGQGHGLRRLGQKPSWPNR
jgi:hypothetical protein